MAFVQASCRKPAAPAGEAAAEAAANAVREPPRLPEDPVGAKIASAQWREHMAHEERERRLGYDRRRLGEHRVVTALIRAQRARYDRARTPAAVARVSAELPAAIADIRRHIDLIDHWGVSSNLLTDYDALLDVLAVSYPAARSAALAGEPAALQEVRAEWRLREKKIADWLAEAASSTDDG